MLPRLIAFSGRKKSGKTELAKTLLQFDYTIINFADELKKLVCNCLNISPEFLEKNKDKSNTYFLDNKINYISKEIEIHIDILKDYINNKQFNSIREILQTLGTDIIRNHNPDWHVNKIKQLILNDNNKRFCIGDCRFPNEKKMIEDLGGICWFIIRPNNLDYSNHISETSLTWKDFGDNIIINNMNKYLLKSRWINYLNFTYINQENLDKEYDLFGTTNLRPFLIKLLSVNKNMFEICQKYNCDYNYMKNLYNMFLIDVSFNSINKNAFFSLENENLNYLKLIKNNGYFKINNNNISFIIECSNKNLVQEVLEYLFDSKDKNMLINTLIYEKIRVNNKENEKIYCLEFNNPFVIENLKKYI